MLKGYGTEQIAKELHDDLFSRTPPALNISMLQIKLIKKYLDEAFAEGAKINIAQPPGPFDPNNPFQPFHPDGNHKITD